LYISIVRDQHEDCDHDVLKVEQLEEEAVFNVPGKAKGQDDDESLDNCKQDQLVKGMHVDVDEENNRVSKEKVEQPSVDVYPALWLLFMHKVFVEFKQIVSFESFELHLNKS